MLRGLAATFLLLALTGAAAPGAPGAPAAPAAPAGESAGEGPLAVEVIFPLALKKESTRNLVRPGLLGSASPFAKSYPLQGRISVTNSGAEPMGPFDVELRPRAPLAFAPETEEEKKKEDARIVLRRWRVEALAPGETKVFAFSIHPPPPEGRPGRTESGLAWTIPAGGERPEISGLYPVTVENPAVYLGPLVLLAGSFLALVLLVVAVKKSGMLARLSNVDLATLGVLSAFVVVGTFIVPLIRSFGVPTNFLVAIGQLPVWLGVLVAARLVRKPGAIGLLLFAYKIVQDLLFYGLSPLTLATETLPLVLTLELYFALTGYGKRLPAALGAVPVYLLATEGLLYGLTMPLFYHMYYAGWYVTSTMTVHFVAYLVWAWLGHRTARSLEEVLR